MLEQISELLVKLVEQFGLFGIFIGTFIESIFPPIPSEIILFSAGFYAQSVNSPALIIIFSIVGAFGNFFGTLPFYYIAKKGSERYLSRFINKFGAVLLISENDLAKSQTFFEKRGPTTIFIARLIPGIRSLIAFPAGISNVKFGTYFIYSIAGSVLWNLFLTSVGYFAYDRKDEIFALLKPVENIVIVGLIATALIYVAKVIWQMLKMRKENAKDSV